MHAHGRSLLRPTRSDCVFRCGNSSRGGSLLRFAKSKTVSARGSNHQGASAVCRNQTATSHRWQKLGNGIKAAAVSALVLLSPSSALADMSMCAAETSNATVEASASVNTVNLENTAQTSDSQAKRQVFFDVNSDGQPLGRIAVELFNDVPVGSLRFFELAEGHEGISYQLSKFNEIGPGFIRVADLQSLTYAAEKAASIAGGETVEQLEVEQEQGKHTHCQPGMVSLIIKDARKRPTKERLVAYNGKLVTVQEQQGAVPNGSGFVITTAAQPAFDATNLVVGKVVSGMDVVEQIAKMPAVKANTGSPFFMVAKLAGDKRADVAEKGFGRPFSRVVIAQSGVSTSS